MKIARIAIKNFLGIDHFDTTLTQPLLLVAGPNAAGKTSIAHGLRFVLADDLCRVTHKKEVKALVREGAKSGSVSVWINSADGPVEYTRSAATGHMTSKHPPPAMHPALPYCLDPPSFVELEAPAHLSFLYYLMGVNRSAASITKLLEERGHAASHIERIATHLSGGFAAAYTEAQGIAREAKGQWRELTGETYGEVKAGSWSRQAPEVDTSHMETLKQDIARFDDEIGKLQSRHGALIERAAERARLLKRTTETRRIAGDLEPRKAAVEECQKKFDELFADERGIREALAEAKTKVTIEAHAKQGAFFDCPVCGAHLNYSRGECAVGTPAAVDVSAEIAAAEERVKEIELALHEVASRKRIVDKLTVDALNAVGQAQAASNALADLAEEVSDGDPARDAGIEEQIGAVTATRAEAKRALDALERAAREHQQAAADTKRAGAIHEEIKAFTSLAAALAPDGLPGELLARALRPINERLRDSAVMAGWSSVSITTSGILVHSRHWALASGSERWRANAMIAEAIAYLSGIKCLVLDSMDILEPAQRAQALTWLVEVAKEHETIICMATLKAPPNNLPAAIQSVWLGEAA